MTRRRGLVVAVVAVLVVAASAVMVVNRLTGDDQAAEVSAGEIPRAQATTTLATTTLASTTVPPVATTTARTTVAPTTTAQTSPTATAPAPAPTTPTTQPAPAPTQPAPAPAPAAGGPAAYRGLGTWVDAFDFDPAHTNGAPTVFPSDVDHMAALGIKTLYLQAARSEDPNAPDDLIRPDLLGQFLTRAHARGMFVVAWFLPHHVDVDDDIRHLQAMVDFRADGQRFDSIALDIEWRNGEADHATRSARLVEVARRLRAASPDRPVGAIVMPPVVTEVLNTSFWPDFPWAELAPLADVFLTMSYWTNRSDGTGYRNAHTYTSENISRLRAHVGNVAVHAIGGIGNRATEADYRDFVRASAEGGSIGWSNYDWYTTAASAWPSLGAG